MASRAVPSLWRPLVMVVLTRTILLLLSTCSFSSFSVLAFAPSLSYLEWGRITRTSSSSLMPTLPLPLGGTSSSNTPPTTTNDDHASSTNSEAEALLAKARQIRAEVAALQGRTLEQVEQEAAAESARRKQTKKEEPKQPSSPLDNDQRFRGDVPETWQDQIHLAQRAVEQAHRDGYNRQIVRFGLIPSQTSNGKRGTIDGDNDNQELLPLYPAMFDNSWPGGAQQIYREAAGPMTQALLQVVRTSNSSKNATSSSASSDDNNWTQTTTYNKPTIRVQDIWDFDGSAVVTAEAPQEAGPANDVQAIVQPNTDTKYTKDIATMDAAMGPNRLLLIVNPFWRNLQSWGINLLAPQAKTLAQQVIFDGGFIETFCLLPKTVRGEDCVALKVYPYDWQLYAYVEEDQGWPYYAPYRIIRLGSTVEEPTAADFGKLIEDMEEFRMSKNMRQLQRMRQRRD